MAIPALVMAGGNWDECPNPFVLRHSFVMLQSYVSSLSDWILFRFT